MSDWIEKCENALTSIESNLGVPFDYERFYSDTAQLPDTYIVYFLVDDYGEGYSDGIETSHQPQLQVSLYFRDKSVFKSITDAIETAFISTGSTRGPCGTIPYQPDTGHYGWRRDFYFYERR